MRKRITKLTVERTGAPASGRVEIFDEFLRGFTLRITANDVRTFAVRARVKGQPQPVAVTIGDAKVLSLDEARERATDVLKQMAKGIDPRSKPAEPSEVTFDRLIIDWAELRLAEAHRSRYAIEEPRRIRAAFPELLTRSAAEISDADVVNAVDRLTREKPGAVRNAIAAARACYGWAVARKQLAANPFAGLPVAKAGERERVLDDDELRDVWAAAGKLGYPYAAFYQLSILTLQRREQVAGMRWSELDLDKALWRIPGARMKMGKPHDVHLSAPVLAVLADIKRIDGCDFVLSTTGDAPICGYAKGKQRLDAAVAKLRREPLAPWVAHDFRRTGVSKLAELGVDSIVADMILAHQPAKLGGVARIYQRHQFSRERAHALDAWAQHVIGLSADNVPLRGRGK